MKDYKPEDFELENEDDEYLTDVMVNVGARSFVMFSNEGTERKVECDTVCLLYTSPSPRDQA